MRRDCMVWHVHQKDGIFNIWSTIVDDYLLDEWTDEETIVHFYIERGIERSKRIAKTNIDRAKHQQCSALLPIRCETV